MLVVVALVSGCTGAGPVLAPAPPTERTPTDDGSYSGPDAGRLRILAGFTASEIAEVTGPGDRCGEAPPVVLGDVTGDGTPEVVLACRTPDAAVFTATDVYVLDGAALLRDAFVEVAALDVYTDSVTALGDLDGDALVELGIGERVHNPLGGAEYPWWTSPHRSPGGSRCATSTATACRSS